MAPTNDWTIMSHETHGGCFCGVIHCGGVYDCQDGLDHEMEDKWNR